MHNGYLNDGELGNYLKDHVAQHDDEDDLQVVLSKLQEEKSGEA